MTRTQAETIALAVGHKADFRIEDVGPHAVTLYLTDRNGKVYRLFGTPDEQFIIYRQDLKLCAAAGIIQASWLMQQLTD